MGYVIIGAVTEDLTEHGGDMYNHPSTLHLDLQPVTVIISLSANCNAFWKISLYAFYVNIDPSFSTLKDFSVVSRENISKRALCSIILLTLFFRLQSTRTKHYFALF